MAKLLNPKKRREIQKLLREVSEQYHMFNPLGDIVTSLEGVLGIELDPDSQIFNDCHVSYETTLPIFLQRSDFAVKISLYRMPSGSYEVTAYLC